MVIGDGHFSLVVVSQTIEYKQINDGPSQTKIYLKFILKIFVGEICIKIIKERFIIIKKSM